MLSFLSLTLKIRVNRTKKTKVYQAAHFTKKVPNTVAPNPQNLYIGFLNEDMGSKSFAIVLMVSSKMTAYKIDGSKH
jgi:hypothetical protein